MQRLADLPLRRKFQRILLLSGGVAMLLAWFAFAVLSAIKMRSDTLVRLDTLAQVAAFNSQAALAFSDTAEARTILNSLRADETVASACIFDASGQVFARMRLREGSGPDCEAPAGRLEGLRHVQIEQPITLENDSLGLLRIHADVSGLWLELARYVSLMVGLSLLALVVALLLGKMLGRRATAPILDLADVARDVSLKRDFALRARPGGSDEVGQLTASFNDMLAQIELRDLELERQRVTLEQQVAERTRELEAARVAAEAASRAKSQFLATMSHEIRTPMNGVLGMTELLLESKLGETQRHFAETVHASGEALLSIINDILDFSKIEAGRLELEDIDFGPGRVMEEVVELLSEQAHRKSLELACAVDDSVPPALHGDANRFRQILLNLVGNAIKFTDHGQVSVKLRASDEGEGVRLHLEVRDTGIGMDEETLDRLFTPFVQADSSHARRFGGSGLGLAIVRELVDLMGGGIRVSSTPGFGSTFSVEVVMRPASCRIDPRPPLASLHGMHVLVVDDHAPNREILRRRLELLGMVCHEAVDAQAAAGFLLERKPSAPPVRCVLVDLHMPGQSGLDLAERMASHPSARGVAWVLVASMLHPGELSRARSLGFSQVLHKPVRPGELERALQAALAGAVDREPSKHAPMPRAAGGAHVLLAEDTPTNQQVARIMLERLGCHVTVVVDGEEALSVLERESFDLVFMDCQMPEMDGFTATRIIRRRCFTSRRGGRLPVIAMTAGVMLEDRNACLEAGMDDFLPKPFRQAELAAMLGRWSAPGVESEGHETAPAAGVDGGA